MHRHLLSLAAVTALLACGSSDRAQPSADQPAAAQPPADPAPTIRVTGIPDENPTELARSYAPLVELLSDALGAPVEYVPVTDYGAAVQALAAGKVDFAWLGGFTHVQARTLAEVVPVVMRDIDRAFQSVFIAGAETGIASPADLRGKTFAFGSKSSTSGHLMPRHFLATEFELTPETAFDGAPVFSGAHDATAKLVEAGKVDAGAMNKQVWERMVAEDHIDTARVRVIWETPPYVDYVWTARAAVPEDQRTAFANAFLGLSPENPAHAAVLERLGARRYVPASPADFDPIEAVAKSVGLLK